MTKIVFFLFFSLAAFSCLSQEPVLITLFPDSNLSIGAGQTEEYLPFIKNKTIAIVANQTSVIKETHLVDSLLSLKVNIKCVFAPEHGFRGNASAGEKISTQTDEKTGLLIVSLYGKHLKPTVEDLKNVDVVLFDIQDVGVRFYTYISTLQYVMEACAEQNKQLIVLDRPNPNGFYVDGPVLEPAYSSFVGMNTVPVVHGLTIGEYATMLNGEKWLSNKLQCKLTVIKVKNYTHKTLYQLPIRPSPNLPDMSAVYLYPSLCFFEGTKISLGRGTDKPFQVIGYPGFKDGSFSFTPRSLPGIAEHPIYQDTLCNGYNLSSFGRMCVLYFKKLNLLWLKGMYDSYPEKEKFFIPFFDKLSGTDQLRLQITNGVSEENIRKSWKDGLDKYKLIRKKYLLYEDFE